MPSFSSARLCKIEASITILRLTKTIVMVLISIALVKMARLEGLEPSTYCLEGSCSIQLNYRRLNGETSRVRTYDQQIKSLLLYQLSYDLDTVMYI